MCLSDQQQRVEIVGSDSVDEVNNHTSGKEFFGPSGTFPFLARLLARSRVSAQHNSIPTLDERLSSNDGGPNPGQLSLVNFLHSEDYPVTTRPHTPEQYCPPTRKQTPGFPGLPPRRSHVHGSVQPSDQIHSQPETSHSTPPAQRDGGANRLPPVENVTKSRPDRSVTPSDALSGHSRKLETEKKCISLFFSNLHYIHPILQKNSFLAQCEKLVWSKSHREREKNSCPPHRRRFLALYNAVCALGAITADEEAIIGTVAIGTPRGLNMTTTNGNPKKTYPPLKLARVFFEQAKVNLGDVFEICSLESTQALFLMVSRLYLQPQRHAAHNSMAKAEP